MGLGGCQGRCCRSKCASVEIGDIFHIHESCASVGVGGISCIFLIHESCASVEIGGISCIFLIHESCASVEIGGIFPIYDWSGLLDKPDQTLTDRRSNQVRQASSTLED